MVNEIGSISENSKWPPGGHLVFFIKMNFNWDELDTKGVLCVKFQNSISSFRGDAGKKFELTEIDKNSKWPPFLRQIR